MKKRFGIYLFCGQMEQGKFKKKFFYLLPASVVIFYISVKILSTYSPIPELSGPPRSCHFPISEETINPLLDTKHLLVSAFMDQRVNGFDVRIIGMFRRDSIQPLYCLFCCGDHLSPLTSADILQHSDNFGFPFVTTDVMCQIPHNCNATHVSLMTNTETVMLFEPTWLPVRNQKTKEDKEKRLQFNFTVCVSNLFGDYNNVLQFTQSLEMYRLLGVDRVVIYNTSCGPELDRLLQSYSQEGFVEVVPWPIDQYLKPSRGWLFTESGGDLHYFGQLTTLNECIYRSMDRSRYVLLNDIDEIIMPYKHNDLMSLMNMLQEQQPDTGVFLIENHIFPKTQFEPSRKFNLSQWNNVPGVNILEHIYREEPDRTQYHPHKMIIQPRMVEQTSVHEVLKSSGKQYKVPLDICRIIHVRVALRGSLTREELKEDKRLWDFSEKLVPNVDKELRRAKLIS